MRASALFSIALFVRVWKVIRIIAGFRVTTCCRWTCSVCGPWFVWVVVFVCGRWVHAISSGLHHCARSSGQVCSMLAVARNRCRQCWEDALADIGPTLGFFLRDTTCVRDYNRCPEGENRRVLDVCKFSKQLFAEGWLDKGDACSPPLQFFGATVQRHCVPASLSIGFVSVQGVLRFRQVV